MTGRRPRSTLFPYTTLFRSIRADDRKLLHAETKPWRLDGKIVMQVVSIEYPTERLHRRIRQKARAEGAKPVGGIGIPESRSQTEYRHMNQHRSQLAFQRRIVFRAARQEA